MMNFKSRYASAAVAVMLLVAGQASAVWTIPTVSIVLPNISLEMPTKKQAAFVAAVAMWIHLRTRGTDYDYKLSDWRDDLDRLMNSYNIFDPAARATIVELFNKWIVGRKLTLNERSTRKAPKADGSVVTIKDKKLKCTGFGVVGLFDAYVIQQLEDLLKSEGNLIKVLALYAAYNAGQVAVITTK